MNEEKYWQNKWIDGKKVLPNNFARRSYAKVKGRKFKTLLDLGAGSGQDSVYFADKGFKVTAIDFSKSGIANIVSLGHKNIKVLQRDIRHITFPQESFDIIYAHLSLHYFNDEETTKIFNKLFKYLKKGGYVFIKCKSTDDSLFGKGVRVGKDMYRKGHVRHFFTKEYMKKKLEQFKVIEIRKTASVYHSYKSSFIEAVATK